MKRLLTALLMAGALLAQQNFTLTAVAPQPVAGFGAGVVGTAGTTTACYWVVTNYIGGSVLSAAPACLSNVPNTLSGSNLVQVSWQAVAGLNVTYDLLKTTGSTPPAPGASVALTTGITATTSNDTGGGLSTYTVAAFTNPIATCLIQLNNRDYNPPVWEAIGCPIALGNIYIKPNAVGNHLNIGSISTLYPFDVTRAQLNTTYSVSATLTTAQVNSGTTILPALTGATFKVQRFVLQALGGATAGCTDVRISDTAGSPVDAVTVTAAALTQNAVNDESVAAGVTLGTFAPTALTAAKGIQVRKTGSACTTATSFRVIVFYTVNS